MWATKQAIHFNNNKTSNQSIQNKIKQTKQMTTNKNKQKQKQKQTKSTIKIKAEHNKYFNFSDVLLILLFSSRAVATAKIQT